MGGLPTDRQSPSSCRSRDQPATEESLGPSPRVDWLILPMRHPAARVVVERLKPGLVLLEDVLDFHRAPPGTVFARKTLKEALELQMTLTAASVVLFWGERI